MNIVGIRWKEKGFANTDQYGNTYGYTSKKVLQFGIKTQVMNDKLELIGEDIYWEDVPTI